MLHSLRLTHIAALAACLVADVPAQSPTSDSTEVRRIEASIALPQGAILRQPLIVAADGITIDGRGAVLVGPAAPGQPKTGRGIGLLAEGRSNITLRNFTIRGFKTGLEIRGGHGWKIENCVFSDNYHDLDFGWGDGDRVGGMILTGVRDVSIVDCKSQRNWNGLDLYDCEKVSVDHCDFSHCSNVCLKMWQACGNVIRNSNLSYGLRIREGEVHARDSTSVLMESGSDDNLFENNDITHGGDGVFIRVLNGWISKGNVFRENDCSYANNNGFESWSPGNTYIDNISNHCSYGFWLGGSDETILIGNVASYNGLKSGFHNAPEADFGHGGIVIVNGTGTHTLIDSNICIGNSGGGIVFRGDRASKGDKWRMRHLVVQRNRLENNRYGLFARFTDGLDLSSNVFKDNVEDMKFEDITDLHKLSGASLKSQRPEVTLRGPSKMTLGSSVTYSASVDAAEQREIRYRWNLDGVISTGESLVCKFDEPGMKSLSLTVDDGQLANIAYRNIYVIGAGEHSATARATRGWVADPDRAQEKIVLSSDSTSLIGDSSVRIHAEPYRGGSIRAVYHPEGAPLDLSKSKTLSFWLKTQNHNNHGFRSPNPILELHSGKVAWKYSPVGLNGLPRGLLGEVAMSPSRGGWAYIEVPLGGGPGWHRAVSHVGARPVFVSKRLQFETIDCGLATSDGTGLATNGEELFCADRGRVFRSMDGRRWSALREIYGTLNATPSWINGMLTFVPSLGVKGSLVLTIKADAKTPLATSGRHLVLYDLETSTWRRHPAIVTMGHGAVFLGKYLYGLAHAIGPNYGGSLCRIDLMSTKASLDDRSLLHPVPGENSWWFSRAAQLASHGGIIYAIKNDWTTPRPGPAKNGDRLLSFDPAAYKPSKFAGTNRWEDKNWKVARTYCSDLGVLPFEVGHGASLVALPAGWGDGFVGASGALFIVAGCSPSNHEGHGRPSDTWAIYDLASKAYRVGRLPGATGPGTSACLFRGKLVIKRGGVQDAEGDQQLWIVTPISAAASRAAIAKQGRDRPDLTRVDRLTLQLSSGGGEAVTIWIDGMRIDGIQHSR